MCVRVCKRACANKRACVHAHTNVCACACACTFSHSYSIWLGTCQLARESIFRRVRIPAPAHSLLVHPARSTGGMIPREISAPVETWNTARYRTTGLNTWQRRLQWLPLWSAWYQSPLSLHPSAVHHQCPGPQVTGESVNTRACSCGHAVIDAR